MHERKLHYYMTCKKFDKGLLENRYDSADMLFRNHIPNIANHIVYLFETITEYRWFSAILS